MVISCHYNDLSSNVVTRDPHGYINWLMIVIYTILAKGWRRKTTYRHAPLTYRPIKCSRSKNSLKAEDDDGGEEKQLIDLLRRR